MTDSGAGGHVRERLISLIRETGPIPIADFMTICLSDPQGGYYATRDPFGRQGDFITAPEVSQMFGELIGSFLRALWLAEGRTDPFHLVEFGPGRGTLMNDVLRAISRDRQMVSSLQVHLVETSPVLRDIQHRTLARSAIEIHWHDDFGGVPGGRLYVIGNEFFDALPIHQYLFDGEHWAERAVGLDEHDALTFGLKPSRFDPVGLGLDLTPYDVGAVFEDSPFSRCLAGAIGDRIARYGGAGLFIDYGHARSGFGDTLQAVRSHDYEGVLENPGDADLTAHVDFMALARAFRNSGLAVAPLMTQSDFLLSLGLLERAGHLGAGKPADVQERIRDDVERLAAPDQMGHLFKALCVTAGNTIPFPFDRSSSGQD